MIRVLLVGFLFVCFSFSGYSQATPQKRAARPEILIIPSDAWCIRHGYIMQGDSSIINREIADYRAALEHDSGLSKVLNKLSEMLQKEGFYPKDLLSVLKSLEAENMQRSLELEGVAETPAESLSRNANVSIHVQVNYEVMKAGLEQKVHVELNAIDQYTGISSQSMIPISSASWDILSL